MIGQLIGPITELAGSWLNAKTQAQQANAKLKLTEAEAKAKILVSKETSVQDWERIMAEASKNSWKDEWLTIVFSVPLIFVFIPDMVPHIQAGFDALSTLPAWYHEILMVIVLASFGVKAGKGVMEMMKK